MKECIKKGLKEGDTLFICNSSPIQYERIDNKPMENYKVFFKYYEKYKDIDIIGTINLKNLEMVFREEALNYHTTRMVLIEKTLAWDDPYVEVVTMNYDGQSKIHKIKHSVFYGKL